MIIPLIISSSAFCGIIDTFASSTNNTSTPTTIFLNIIPTLSIPYAIKLGSILNPI
jgi:hypothetical protein